VAEEEQEWPRKVSPTYLDDSTARFCGHWADKGVLCLKPAVLHVVYDWDEWFVGFSCAEHALDLGRFWLYDQAHALGSDCGMPGSEWDGEENVCRCDDAFDEEHLVSEVEVVGLPLEGLQEATGAPLARQDGELDAQDVQAQTEMTPADQQPEPAPYTLEYLLVKGTVACIRSREEAETLAARAKSIGLIAEVSYDADMDFIVSILEDVTRLSDEELDRRFNDHMQQASRLSRYGKLMSVTPWEETEWGKEQRRRRAFAKLSHRELRERLRELNKEQREFVRAKARAPYDSKSLHECEAELDRRRGKMTKFERQLFDGGDAWLDEAKAEEFANVARALGLKVEEYVEWQWGGYCVSILDDSPSPETNGPIG
jgi:hypothetical protein